MFLAKAGALWSGAKRTLSALERASGALGSRLFCRLGLGWVAGGGRDWGSCRHIGGHERARALLLEAERVLAEARDRLGKLDRVHCVWLCSELVADTRLV